MKSSNDWINILRSDALFKLHRYPDNNVGLDYTFEAPRNHMPHSPMEIHIPEFHVCADNFEGVDYINITDMHHNSDADYPQSVEPACSQSAKQITMCWTTEESRKHLHKCNFDESVGISIPNGVPETSIHWDKVLPQNPSTGHFHVYDPIFHREDYPAVIAIGGIKRWHKLGKLHRKGGRAAIRADYVMAQWFRDGNRSRINGPSSVLIEDYQEFYENGIFCGCRFKNISEGWDGEPPVPLFTTNPLSNRYFSDPQDEMFCMAALAS